MPGDSVPWHRGQSTGPRTRAPAVHREGLCSGLGRLLQAGEEEPGTRAAVAGLPTREERAGYPSLTPQMSAEPTEIAGATGLEVEPH